MSQVSTKPASGLRDFLPREVLRRKRVFAVIEEVFQSFGFDPLETPTMERLTTLMGKYGEEGDQLIFKVLQRGDKLVKALEKPAPRETDLAELGLRYDLTVPLARVVAEYRNDLPRYFKRYHIAPVWRADRPQKGRFREFYQCDVDVVGSLAMTAEAEVTAALTTVLKRLRFENFRIHVNHRLLLTALMEHVGVPTERHGQAIAAIDKLDKVGMDGVVAELRERQIDDVAIDGLLPLLRDSAVSGGTTVDNEATLSRLEAEVGHLASGRKAIDELRALLRLAQAGPAADVLIIDPYLARGLSYYTGPIFEIRSDDFSGSLGGGGRYDGLIGMFGREQIPACGFSLGVERILLLMEERGMFADEAPSVDVLVTLWNADFAPHSLALAHELRQAGLRVDLYPDEDKFARQLKYADQRGIGFVAILAPDELEQDMVAFKNLQSGEQQRVARTQAATWLRAQLGR